jgi:hypothetical protein
MVDAIKRPKREMPFLLRIGDTYTIVVDNEPLVHVATGSMEGLLLLIASHYIFNIHWCPKVLPALRFIQTQILQLEDDLTSKCAKLNVFLNQYREKLKDSDV